MVTPILISREGAENNTSIEWEEPTDEDLLENEIENGTEIELATTLWKGSRRFLIRKTQMKGP